MNKNAFKGYALALLASFFWSGTAPGIQYLLDTLHMPRFTVALWRDVFVALAALGFIALLRPAWLRVPRPSWRGLIFTGVLSIGLYHIIWVYSIAYNGTAVALVLIYLYPTLVTIGAWLFLKEHITALHVIALFIALVGCALVVRIYDPSLVRLSWIGIAIGLISALMQTVYVLFNQRAVTKVNPWASLAYMMAFGAFTIFVLVVLFRPAELFAVPSTNAWLILIFLAVGPTLLGYGLFNMALHYIPGKVAGLVAVMEILFGSALSFFVNGDVLEPLQLLGVAFVIVATLLPGIQIWRNRASQSATPAAQNN